MGKYAISLFHTPFVFMNLPQANPRREIETSQIGLYAVITPTCPRDRKWHEVGVVEKCNKSLRMIIYWLLQNVTNCHNSVVCLTTGLQPVQKRVLHTVTSSASSFNFLISLTSSSSCLLLLPPFPVPIFPAITCCIWQFLCSALLRTL